MLYRRCPSVLGLSGGYAPVGVAVRILGHIVLR